jgi:hypothetical protein
MEWQKEELNPPQEVITATQEYRDEEDVIGRFIKDCCVTSKGNSAVRALARDLHETYKNWCSDVGEPAVSQKQFGTYLTANEYPSDNSSGRGTWRIGIGLRAKEAPEDPPPKTANHYGQTANHQDSKVSSGNYLKDNGKSNISEANANLANRKSDSLAGLQCSTRQYGNKISKVSICGDSTDEDISNQSDVGDNHRDWKVSNFGSKVSTQLPLGDGPSCPDCAENTVRALGNQWYCSKCTRYVVAPAPSGSAECGICPQCEKPTTKGEVTGVFFCSCGWREDSSTAISPGAGEAIEGSH